MMPILSPGECAARQGVYSSLIAVVSLLECPLYQNAGLSNLHREQAAASAKRGRCAGESGPSPRPSLHAATSYAPRRQAGVMLLSQLIFIADASASAVTAQSPMFLR
jgi:hypothetical protein